MTYKKTLLALLTVCVGTAFQAQAFSLSKFTYNSRLSTGKWVKVAVPHDGIYQITAQQLAEMGFSDPSRVQIYGQGGHIISEVLDGKAVDDLVPAAMMTLPDKVVFYGQGVVGRQMRDNTYTYPYYTHQRNGYANQGYYFITETDAAVPVTLQEQVIPGDKWLTTSYDLFIHEQELTSPGGTGKQLLGESLLPNGVTFDYSLPLLCDNALIVQMNAAAHLTAAAKANVEFLGDTLVAFTDYQKIIKSVYQDVQRYYNTTPAPTKLFKMANLNEQGQIKVSLDNSQGATVKMACLDYVNLTYKHHNSYPDGATSFTMGIPVSAANTCVVMPGTDSTTVVWNVSDPQNVVQMQLTPAVDEQGDTVGMSFTPGYNMKASEFIAFVPALEQRAIGEAVPVLNQNIHGLTTPDMVIITNAYFKAEAERLAQLHRDVDGLTVHVIDQEQIFNEFSSGTPDASAVRLMCKMFYDRNATKFKYLLMFGPASYDYRGITTDKPNRVITYETDQGDSDETSYGTDDFFGMLVDNSGSDLTTSRLNLGIGRLTPTDLTQARQNVDKVIQYVANPDYGVWRNHYTIWSDTGNDDLHVLQSESINNKLQETLGIPMVADKAYLDMFATKADTKQHIIDMLNAGQYYGTFVGHANASSLFNSKVWTTSNVRGMTYAHQPIFMTACCNVARYDSNDQGIAELMLHQPDGGAIALLTPSREVEAQRNHYLNQAFTEAMFGYNSTGKMTTLGQAYMKAKQAYSTLTTTDSYVTNKMSYMLLGDPAINVQYPKPLFNITSINGVDITPGDTTVRLSPLQQVIIEAVVMKAGNMQVDTSFNGDATVSIYDAKRLLKNATYSVSNYSISGDIFYPRDLLAEVQGRVVNGHFTATAILPRYIKAQPGEELAIHVYAHQDNSAEMVNGMTTKAAALAYDEQLAVQDQSAPLIELMFINEQEAFDRGCTVGPNSMLHVTATDDVAFNNQGVGVGSATRLVLDGKTNCTNVGNYVSLADGGKTLTVNYPVSGLAPGQHSLTITVHDVAGNAAERTINFVVGGESAITIASDDAVAVSQATVTLGESTVEAMPAMTLKVVNNKGQLVWSASNVTLPYTWSLTDAQGARVAPGRYIMFGQYNDGATYGGTNAVPIIVIDPVNN